MIHKVTPLDAMIAAIYSPQIERDYGMTWDEFGAHVDAHGGELPPLKDSPFGDMPACWPHLFCTHAGSADD
jgi:hypothetical protein